MVSLIDFYAVRMVKSFKNEGFKTNKHTVQRRLRITHLKKKSKTELRFLEPVKTLDQGTIQRYLVSRLRVVATSDYS